MPAQRETGQLLGAIFSASPDAVVVIDATGRIVLSSPAVQTLFGYYPEELVGEPIEILLPPERQTRHVEHLRAFFAAPRARQMGEGLELAGRRRDGAEFAVDVSLTPVEVAGTPFAAAFVRDARERQREIDRLQAVNAISQRLLGGADVDEILPVVAERARRLAGADAAWIVMPRSASELEIVAADGAASSSLLGVRLSAATSRSARVMASGLSDVVEDLSSAGNVPDEVVHLGLGPGVYVPLIADDRRFGVLVVGRLEGRALFARLEVALFEVFASATAAAIEVGQVRAELGRLEIVSEDERIARDLHDTVIQELFAIGLSLEVARASAASPAAERIESAIVGLEGVIRQIRDTIFRLPLRSGDAGSLRDEMLRVTEKFRGELGFRPRVAFHGAVDAAVPDAVSAHLLQVIGEGLSNIARHARASSAEVVVEVADGWCSLSLVDDGVGFVAQPSAGHGVRNMVARAIELGGTCELTHRDPTGTILSWRVPV